MRLNGDQHGRSKATDIGSDQDIFERDIGGGISGSKKVHPYFRDGNRR